ncbi:MAG: N-acetyl-alpha-D-glucosaminyl L-malate synthase BshA [bacterium]|nr:N-acetyl-alpha-D-glucosaminyl L-malate synthase BshA [bacterium]
MDSCLKIGIICHPTYGGSGVVASELALSLADEGHCVHLFSHDVPPRLARSPGPVEVHVAQGVPYPLFHSTPHDLAITSRILDLHRSTGLDILHAHYALPHAVSAILARDAARSDCSDRPPPRVVTTLHGTDITLVGNEPSYHPLTQYTIRASDAVTTVSSALAERTRENFGDGKQCPFDIDVIPNFVDLETFRPNGQADGPPSAVHVSNFRRVKRVPWLVRAFAEASEGTDAHLTLVGDGPEQDEARRVAQEHGLAGRVRFLGMRDALPELLSPADVYALTSQDESFGLSALEAMACATPVVATDVGGVGEVVVDGVTGFLAPADDRAAYAAKLRALLVDRERAREMGRAARARCEEHFERRRIVAHYTDLYRRLLIEDRTPTGRP